MKIPFRRIETPIAFLGIGAVLSIIALSCVKIPTEPTIFPQSDIQASIPIIDRTWTLGQLYGKKSSNVSYVDSLHTQVYQSVLNTKPLALDTLKATPHDQSSKVALGEITLPGLSSSSQSFTASDLGATTGTYLSPPLPSYPGASTSLQGISLPASGQFDWLGVDSGTVSLTITNTLPLQISFPQGLRLKNNSTSPQDTTTIAPFNIPQIDSAGTAGSTWTGSFTISKKIVYAALKSDSIKVNLLGRTGSFTISPTAGVSFTFSSGSFLVDSAAAVIPNQTIVPTTDSLFTVDDSIVVKDADFRSGSFNAVIKNHSNVTVAMYLQFNDLVNTQSNQSFLINQNLLPNDSIVSPVNLSQYSIHTTPSNLGSKISFRLGISSIQSVNKISITSHDFITSGIEVTSPFVIKSVTGKIKPTTLIVNNGMPGLQGDVSNFSATSINFSSQSITLNLGVYSGFVTDYNLTLTGISRAQNKTVTLVIPPPAGSAQNRITPSANGLAQIVLNNSTGFGTFLSSFFQAIPDTFILNGSVTINPSDVFGTPGGYATIYDTSKLYSSVDFYFPLDVGISNAQYADVVPIKGKFDSSFVGNTKSGSLYFTISNGLPVSFGFLATFQKYDPVIKGPRTLLTVPVSGAPEIIQGGKVNASGIVTSDSSTSFSLSLYNAQIQQLVNADSVGVLFLLSTSSGASVPVVFDSTYTIHVRASANMVYTLKEKNQ